MQVIAPVVGWLVPGGGHFIQKRWVRGCSFFLSVRVMFLCGLGMQGKVYGFNAGDMLDMLGFTGDFGNGRTLFRRKRMGWGQGAIYRATADYGTKYIVGRHAEHDLRRGRSPHRDREETMNLKLSHFSAALLFAIWPRWYSASRSGTPAEDSVRPYCLDGSSAACLAGWVMWIIKR